MLTLPLDTLLQLSAWLMVGLWALNRWLTGRWFWLGLGGMLALTWLPILPLPLPSYFLGAAGNLSLLSCLLLFGWLLHTLAGIKAKPLAAPPPQPKRQARWALMLFLIGGLLLQLSAIVPTAITPTGAQALAFADFYRWGFIHHGLAAAPFINGLLLLILASAISMLLWFWGYQRLAWSVAVAALITALNEMFQWSLLPSANVWDSFIDPYLLAVGVLRLRTREFE